MAAQLVAFGLGLTVTLGCNQAQCGVAQGDQLPGFGDKGFRGLVDLPAVSVPEVDAAALGVVAQRV
ncbi:Uncharacterised protein [Mycobacteroides abscessus subsp. abscessus]|nr:Uncharacterised protein [Mycobacteroides abscessus subsp. abscessus]